MGRLVPEDFDLATLANAEERWVVEALRDGTTDGWLILPDVGLATHRDHQIDVLLVHADHGVLVIEVKGHEVQLRDGRWTSNGSVLATQPTEQAKTNAYALRSRLRALGSDLAHVDVAYGVAFPNVGAIDGSLPPEISREQVLTSTELAEPQDAIDRLLCARWWSTRLPWDAVEAIVADLRPSAELHLDPDARARATRERLDELCDWQVAAMATLDVNPRVYVAGRAGTGKTRLATTWARRAVIQREERVFLTCYNDPLSSGLHERLPFDEGDDILIGSFLRTALALPGMAHLDIPPDADNEWWQDTALDHLTRHWNQVEVSFDTIVVDEGQDFRPEWLALLERLLDPDGPQRLLMVGDDAQDLFERGFAPPSPEDGWACAELVYNCRNARQIATILRRHLGGAQSPSVAPEALGIEAMAAHDEATVIRQVHEALYQRLTLAGRDRSSIVVATFTRSLRDPLRAALDLVAWEERGQGKVVCENVQRIKGLEADCVILATATAEVSDPLLYVGVSRAVSELVVVGPEEMTTRAGFRSS